MEKIDVTVDIKAPIEEVFNILSEHDSYSRFNGVLSSTLLQRGEYEKNGKGAIRKIDAVGITFIEEIPAFERNYFFEYKVIQCYFNMGLLQIDIPLVHLLGRVNFKKIENGTQVNWISIIDLDVPVLRDELTKVFSYNGGNGFYFLLQQLKYNLELKQY